MMIPSDNTWLRSGAIGDKRAIINDGRLSSFALLIIVPFLSHPGHHYNYRMPK
jgi:hypothetical protein